MSDAIKTLYHQRKDLLFQTAQEYTEGGLWMVCVHSALSANSIKRGKAPSHFGWQKERLSWQQLEAEMQRVWSKEGGCNIGLKTGIESGLVCVDVDAKSGGLGWYHENSMHLGNPIIEHTGGEGLHLYYRYPKGITGELKTRSSAKRVFKGVDILCDGAGQVVTFPSIHYSGTPYKIENNLNLLDALEEADELPQWIVELIVESAQRDQEKSKEVERAVVTSALEADVYAARNALRSFPPALEGDGGDMRTLQAAMLCKDYGLGAKEVYELLVSEYNPRCSPPWKPEELKQKVKNAFRYGKMTQGVRSIANTFEELDLSAQIPAAHDDREVSTEIDRSSAYSKKNAIHSAQVFIKRNKDTIGCYDQQLVYWDKTGCKWRVAREGDFDNLIYRDIAASCNNGQLIQTMKVNFISDVRRAVKLELNVGQAIPDVHFKGKGSRCSFITLNNGILDVESGELMAHTPNWFCFTSVDLNYDEKAECPIFKGFLQDIWDGDSELIESLQLWIGYCLLTQTNLQRFAIFKGASRAGKSTLVSVIEGLVGENNSASTSLSLIGSDFGLESLLGKKLVVFQDADRASADRMGVATERIKSLASNDPMGINRKGQSVVFQRLGVKVNFVCNKVPSFLNDENALTNRMVVFPFWKSYQGREDVELADKLKGELAGIFNWALVGARRLLRGERKLFTSQKGLEALDEIAQQLDSVQGFLAECVEVTNLDHNVVTTDQLWESYKLWCTDSGRAHKNRQRFLTEACSRPVLAERRSRTTNVRVYRGIRLRNADGRSVFSTLDDTDTEVPF